MCGKGQRFLKKGSGESRKKLLIFLLLVNRFLRMWRTFFVSQRISFWKLGCQSTCEIFWFKLQFLNISTILATVSCCTCISSFKSVSNLSIFYHVKLFLCVHAFIHNNSTLDCRSFINMFLHNVKIVIEAIKFNTLLKLIQVIQFFGVR